MTSSSKNSTKRGKLLDLPLITSTEKWGLASIFFGWAPGKGWYPYFLGGRLQTQGETMGDNPRSN